MDSECSELPDGSHDEVRPVLEPEYWNDVFVCKTAVEPFYFQTRYFVEPSTERLFERWFHLNDVVRDLPPLIKAFQSSEECRTVENGTEFLPSAFIRVEAVNGAQSTDDFTQTQVFTYCRIWHS
ncbi:hypothetical protein NECAME_08150 [Necator americanus]|uniref:Uncharacterized protein n=1 Tax=Necator americanus TaxID=51031 RepID=W2TJ15_NECAM|nr:hypothetical protein NECAME_08150 [Necator americanus]ETN82100.1 hypothetical protein NECAME_08150 [Necator americanus]